MPVNNFDSCFSPSFEQGLDKVMLNAGNILDISLLGELSKFLHFSRREPLIHMKPSNFGETRRGT
jgi:hypothetical protein